MSSRKHPSDRGERKAIKHQRKRRVNHRLRREAILNTRTVDEALNEDYKDVKAVCGMLADTPQPCSCNMCRNQRRNKYNTGRNRKTIQERRFDDSIAGE